MKAIVWGNTFERASKKLGQESYGVQLLKEP